MEIIAHTFEEMIDPTGILEGKRFEFFLSIEVDEDDEVYSEKGLFIRAIIAEVNGHYKVSQTTFVERDTEQVLEFGLEDEEVEAVLQYCVNVFQSEIA